VVLIVLSISPVSLDSFGLRMFKNLINDLQIDFFIRLKKRRPLMRIRRRRGRE
jgi:hypothetical protein